ncbi:MAG TPA: redoxin domain-containing protein [Planctomycetota bacterium]|nr:redoxin domain-containing protein [Planctomycetota bacterium]
MRNLLFFIVAALSLSGSSSRFGVVIAQDEAVSKPDDTSVSPKREERKPPEPLAIGSPAPDFDLVGVDDKRYRLADFADAKVLAVVFTCNHCPTAQAYEDRLLQLANDYKEKGVAIVAISPNDPKAVRLDELGYTDVGDSFEEMKIRAKAKRFPFPYLYDGDTQEVSRKYGPTATPHVFIFDQERRLRYRGRIDDTESGKDIRRHDAREAIDALLLGNPITVSTTRVFGCSVKWSEARKSNEEFLARLAREEVTLADIDEEGVKKLRKNDTKKLLLVNVWATWCAPCRAEFPALVETNRMYRHRAFEMVTIDLDSVEQRSDAHEFLKKVQASNRNFHWGTDDLDALADALDPEWSGALPLTVLIAPGGEIKYRRVGEIEPLELRRAIVDVLGRTYH